MTILDRPLKHVKVGGLVGAVASWRDACPLDQVGECRTLRLQRGRRLARFLLRPRPVRLPFVSPTQASFNQRVSAAIPVQVGGEDRGRRFGVSERGMRGSPQSKGSGAVDEPPPSATYGQPRGQFHRADHRQGRDVDPGARQFVLDEGSIEAGVVRDQDMAGKPLEDIAEDVSEAGGVGDLPSPDSVDAGRTEVPVGAEQRRPTVEDLATGVGRQQRQLDDAVLGSHVQPGRLAVDDRRQGGRR
jgi:hypothetical protein